jgi:hypothetical protein
MKREGRSRAAVAENEVTPAQIEGFLTDTRCATDAAGKPFSQAARRHRARSPPS